MSPEMTTRDKWIFSFVLMAIVGFLVWFEYTNVGAVVVRVITAIVVVSTLAFHLVRGVLSGDFWDIAGDIKKKRARTPVNIANSPHRFNRPASSKYFPR